MTTTKRQRLLILAPAGNDALLTASFLNAAHVDAEICHDVDESVARISEGCGGLIIAEEALAGKASTVLVDLLEKQPSWSELPILIITRGGNVPSDTLKRLNVFGPSGNVTLLERPFRPLTLVNAAQAALRSRRRQYQVRDLLDERETVLASINDSFVSVDRQWRYTYVNDRAAAVAGWAKEEMLGRNLWALYPQFVDTPLYFQLLHSLEHQEILRFEHHQTANARWLDVRVYPSPRGLSILSVDITERKLAENELRAAKEELSRANHELEQRVEERTAQLTASNDQLEAFVYSIAHDLRAPLRAMQAYASMLLEDYGIKLGETGNHYAQRIVHSAEAMDRLVIDLLAYGRVARSEISLARVDVEAVWQTALAQCEADLETSQAVVETIPPFGHVIAHEATLGQVLANLLTNAIKFVAPGTSPHIRFRSEQQGSSTRLLVEDNGIGIAPAHQERIFRVFERLHGTSYTGTGIGLSIVRKGTERMGGRVGLSSAVGQGSCFWIELPTAPPESES